MSLELLPRPGSELSPDEVQVGAAWNWGWMLSVVVSGGCQEAAVPSKLVKVCQSLSISLSSLHMMIYDDVTKAS